MNYLTNEHYEAFQRGLHSLPSGPMRDAVKAVLANRPKPVADRSIYLFESDDQVTRFVKKDGRWYVDDLCGLYGEEEPPEDNQPKRWLPTEDGYAVRVDKYGNRIVHYVRDGEVGQNLNADGTLFLPTNPADFDGTWEPLIALPKITIGTQKGDPQ